jgi:hypothetical protein
MTTVIDVGRKSGAIARGAGVAGLLAGAVTLGAAGHAWASTGRVQLNLARTGAQASGSVIVQVNPSQHKQGFLRPGFFGLSFPSSELNSGHFVAAGNVPALLENLGVGVLRFGGGSVDTPSFTGISESAAKGLATLARRTGWKVLYSVNLGQFQAAQVKADARRVASALGPSLLAIACGNEPELYPGRYRPSGYDEADYLSSDVPRCLKAVRSGAPGVPFAGPDTFRVAGSPGHWTTPWLPPYAQAARAGKIPGLSLLSVHLYPASYCHGTVEPPAALISHAVDQKEEGILSDFMSASATAGVPYIISESNSASCGGIPGVSNSFASALWSADWLALAAERNAVSVDLNGGLSGCGVYSPLCQAGPHEYTAEPVYYGMLFLHMLGTGRMFFTPLTVMGPSGAHVVAHSVVSSSGVVRVMVENLGSVPENVLLKYGKVTGTGLSWYLTAPSVGATSGVRIQGAAVAGNGIFKPGLPGQVSCRSGNCRLSLPAYSAVIVKLPS